MLQQFRTEVHAWLDANCPASMRTPLTDDEEVWGGSQQKFTNPESKIWLDRMSAKGWTAPEWPVEYGGGGLNPQEAQVLKEEMQKLRCRTPLLSFGIWMLGPVLLQYGSDEQKKRVLPGITRGDIRWCQGYSEPAAGSDLASLQTRAEPVGENFIINGSKVWTSYADSSDWIFCLVRTDSSSNKQHGISFMLIDMHQPGVKAEPIRLISGASPFCEVFFADAKTSQQNLIGPLNGGWQIAKALLTHERQAISALNKKASELPIEIFAKQKMTTVNGQIADESFRQRLAAFLVDQVAFEWTLERETALQKSGHSPGAASSMFKLYSSELNKRKYELMMEAAGFQGLVWEGNGEEKDRQTTRSWLRSKGNSIEGGTSEIQLNVIAKRVLGLP